MMRRTCCTLAILSVFASSACWTLGYEVGEAVEVREGDTWSPAKIVTKEGRRYKIRYEGGTDEEWVASDRLRDAGGASDNGVSAPDSVLPTAPETDAGEKAAWRMGDKAEVKRGREWRPAIVMKSENGWFLVLYSPGGFNEWVEPYRMRTPGSTQDIVGLAPMHPEVKGEMPAPKEPPKEGPALVGGGASSTTHFPDWREPGMRDRVMFGFGERVEYGRYMEKRDGRVRVLLDNGRDQWVNELDVRMAGSRLNVKVGDRVLCHDWDWKTGSVVLREGDRARIKLDDGGEKWKTLDELRPPPSNDVDISSPQAMRRLPFYREANVATARKLSLMVQRGGAAFSPDAAKVNADTTSLRSATVRGAAGNAYPRAIIASHSESGVVAVAAQVDNQDAVVIDRFDARTGRSLSSVKIEPQKDMRICDISPNGMMALFRKQGGRHDQIEIWSIDGAPVRGLLMFPYGMDQHDRDVRFAAFVGDNRILTTGGKDELELWDTITGRAIYVTTCRRDAEPAISAGGKYIALTTGQEALVIEAATGSARIELPKSMARANRFAFSPSGCELVACDARTVWVFDLVKGELAREFTLPGSITCRQIASPADGYALINESILLSLQRRTPVWKYEKPGRTAVAVLPHGQMAFAVDGTGRMPASLTAETIPHPAALKTLEASPTPLAVLQPGGKISFDLRVNCSAEERQKITQYVERHFADRQIEIAQGQSVRLVMTVENGERQSREFRLRGFLTQEVYYTPKISRIRIESKGKTLWETSSVVGDPGGFLSVKPGQSLQDAVNELGRHPDLKIFSTAPLPVYLVQPSNPMVLGVSEPGDRGFVDKKAEPEPETPANERPRRETVRDDLTA